MFKIDTGARMNAPRIDRPEIMLDAIRDRLPEDATQAQIDDALVQAIYAELRAPKTAKTVRRRWCQLWSLIAPLAEREPAQFDSLFMEFLERIDALE